MTEAIGINGSMNRAIVIRSFLSKNHALNYQAGAVRFQPESEIAESGQQAGRADESD
ncbi:MAG TPA: hypothetical protein VNJ07_02705 [Chitinophagales bacterium]|nr:hypothetical protein [Chitinophagales bacterium]